MIRSENIANALIEQSLTAAVMALAVWGILSLNRNWSARFRYTLWFLVLLKLVVPGLPVISAPDFDRLSAWVRPATVTAIASATPGLPAGAPAADSTPRSIVQAAAMENSGHTFSWRKALLAIWFAGAIAFAASISWRAYRVSRSLKERRTDPDLAIECEFVEMLQALNVRRRPPLRMIEGISQPFVWGPHGGAIYLPNDFARQGTRRQRQLIIAHELAHVLRRDVWMNLAQLMVQTLFWFHPMAWWVNRAIRIEREKCCDELAIAALDVAPAEYSAAILDRLAEHWEPGRPSSSLAISGGMNDLERRIRSILRPGRTFSFRPSAGWKVAVVLFCLAILGPGIGSGAGTKAHLGEVGPGAYRPMPLPKNSVKRLDSNWLPRDTDNSLRALAGGPLTFQDIPFQIEGVLQLRGGSEDTADFPRSTGPITINGPVQAIHLLHGTAGRAAQGEAILSVLVTYDNGATARIAMRYGEQARDWWFWDFEPIEDPLSRTFWTGSNTAVHQTGGALRLYQTSLPNPNPDQNVRAVEFISTESESAPMILALTLK